VSLVIQFLPWRSFYARKRQQDIGRWLKAIGDAGVKAFKGGMGHYPPASAPGAWPARRTGRLHASVRSETTSDSVTIGSGMPYSIYLRMGTSRMARRKMSDDALKEGMKAGHLGRWVEFSRS
jgi:hypothetical protein